MQRVDQFLAMSRDGGVFHVEAFREYENGPVFYQAPIQRTVNRIDDTEFEFNHPSEGIIRIYRIADLDKVSASIHAMQNGASFDQTVAENGLDLQRIVAVYLSGRDEKPYGDAYAGAFADGAGTNPPDTCGIDANSLEKGMQQVIADLKIALEKIKSIIENATNSDIDPTEA